MFSDEERKVFAYDDGTGTVYADPEAVYLALAREFQGDVAGAVLRAESADPLEAAEAEAQLAEAARRVFGLAAFDPRTGAGATQRMCRRVFDAYLDWALEKKTPPGDSPGDCTTTEAPGSPSGPTRPPSLACGSTSPS